MNPPFPVDPPYVSRNRTHGRCARVQPAAVTPAALLPRATPTVQGLELLHPVVVAVHGRIGDRVFKTYGDKIVVTRMPCFDGYAPSPAQRKQRDRMRAATAYAQMVYAEPRAKALYIAAALRLGRKPFRLAISDYFARGNPEADQRVRLVIGGERPVEGSDSATNEAGTSRNAARRERPSIAQRKRPSDASWRFESPAASRPRRTDVASPLSSRASRPAASARAPRRAT